MANRVPEKVAQTATTADVAGLQQTYGRQVTLANGLKINSTWYTAPDRTATGKLAAYKPSGLDAARFANAEKEYAKQVAARGVERKRLFDKTTSGRMAGIKFATIAAAARASGAGNARLGIDPVRSLTAARAGGGGGGRRG